MSDVVCVDCIAEGVTRARPVAYGAAKNRCTTHHRAVRKARKARSQDLRREKVYGLTPQAFNELLEIQGGVCAVCARRMSRPCVDHDHDCCPGPTSCGRCVRGILHPSCNFDIIGKLNVETLLRAARYILSPPGLLIRRDQ